MFTHKFECPMEIVSLAGGNYRKAEHIYVIDGCDIRT